MFNFSLDKQTISLCFRFSEIECWLSSQHSAHSSHLCCHLSLQMICWIWMMNYITCITHLFLLLLTAVIATTTTTVVTTTTPQHYPRQATATPVQSYQGSQYPPYQPVPVQTGYPAQPMPQTYGPQPMPTTPYQGQPFTAGPPPTYQEASGWILVTGLIVESRTTNHN